MHDCPALYWLVQLAWEVLVMRVIMSKFVSKIRKERRRCNVA